MKKRIIAWEDGTWSTPPVAAHRHGDALIVTAEERSDYWERTLYGFRHDTGHALLVPWDPAEAVEVTFLLEGFTGLYDQAGLMVWHGPQQWIKAGVEISDGVPSLGAVVTDGYSDWSLSPVPEWAGQPVTMRASRLSDGVILRARAGGGSWRTIRVARFAHNDAVHAGPFTCAPTRAGLDVTFVRWLMTAPDEELHTQPPHDVIV
ncbi:MAG: DUF1349 domain-containing protein [Micromonosporaceae bacterium]|nr:DUF1349 domain-containing protein [Micromonosporaceae bacterium]